MTVNGHDRKQLTLDRAGAPSIGSSKGYRANRAAQAISSSSAQSGTPTRGEDRLPLNNGRRGALLIQSGRPVTLHYPRAGTSTKRLTTNGLAGNGPGCRRRIEQVLL